MFNETNCSDSTISNKVVVFDVSSNVSGVFMDDETGCIEVRATGAQEIIGVVDKLIYTLTKE